MVWESKRGGYLEELVVDESLVSSAYAMLSSDSEETELAADGTCCLLREPTVGVGYKN